MMIHYHYDSPRLETDYRLSIVQIQRYEDFGSACPKIWLNRTFQRGFLVSK